MTNTPGGKQAIALIGVASLLSPLAILGFWMSFLPAEMPFVPFLVLVAVHAVLLVPAFIVMTARAVLLRPFGSRTKFLPALAIVLTLTLDVVAVRMGRDLTTPAQIRFHFVVHQPTVEQSPYRIFMNPGIVDGAGYFVHTDDVDAHGNGRFRIGNRIVTAPAGYAVIGPTETWHTRAITCSLGGGWWYATARV
jgi:hypothetical protein